MKFLFFAILGFRVKMGDHVSPLPGLPGPPQISNHIQQHSNNNNQTGNHSTTTNNTVSHFCNEHQRNIFLQGYFVVILNGLLLKGDTVDPQRYPLNNKVSLG